jgi:hypothetical protein
MQIGHPSAHENQSSPHSAALAEGAAQDSQLTLFSGQHWTYISLHGVGTELGFPFCYSKWGFMEKKRYWVYEWTWMRATGDMYDRLWPDFSVIAGVQCEVQLVKYGYAWCSLKGPWNSPMQPLDSPSVITELLGPPGFQEWAEVGWAN